MLLGKTLSNMNTKMIHSDQEIFDQTRFLRLDFDDFFTNLLKNHMEFWK